MSNGASPRVLFVDDEPLMEILVTQRFRHLMSAGSAEFRFARSLTSARSILFEGPGIDVVLCDINLGTESGIDFLRDSAERPGGHRGCHGHRLQRHGHDSQLYELGSLLILFLNLLTSLILNKPFETLLNMLIRCEYTMPNISVWSCWIVNWRWPEPCSCRCFHRQLVRLMSLDEARVFASFQANGAVGGDFFDYFQPNRRILVFAMGDVSGSGIVGAMWMGICHTLLRAMGMITPRFRSFQSPTDYEHDSV